MNIFLFLQPMKKSMTTFTKVVLLLQFLIGIEISFVEGYDNGLSIYNALRAGGLLDDKKPYFDNTKPTKIVAQVGTTAQLSCKVLNLNNHTVSWIRHRDLHILAVGPYAYTNDDRYESVYRPKYEDFQLLIKFAQPKDAGIYECQVSTEPVSAYHILLQVKGLNGKVKQEPKRKPNRDEIHDFHHSDHSTPLATILNGDDIYVAEGSMINITCVISQSRVENVFWYHEEKVISYYSPRSGSGGVSIVTEKSDFSLNSQLLIRDAQPEDQGTYTCSLTNANANVEAKTRVFVLREDEMRPEQNSAVMYASKGDRNPVQDTLSFLLLATLYCIT